MITYFKMKHAEWKIKKMFYNMILTIIDNQEEFISKLAEMVYEENKNKEN